MIEAITCYQHRKSLKGKVVLGENLTFGPSVVVVEVH